MLILLDLSNDIVGDHVASHIHRIIEDNVLDREVDEIGGVMNGDGHHGGMVVGKDGRNTKIERLSFKVMLVSFVSKI